MSTRGALTGSALSVLRGNTRFIIMGLAAAAFLLCVAGLASAGPDLVVANADVDIDVRSPTQGNTVTLEAVVHNNGNAAAGAFSVRFTLDSSATLATVAVSGLAAGATANVTASWDVGSTSLGAHSVQAIADSGSAVAEDSEANNQGSYAFSVNDAPSAAAAVNNTPLSTLVPFGFSSTG